MCKAIEDMRAEAAALAKKESQLGIAMQLLAMGVLTEEQIAQFTKLTPEEVQELAKEVQMSV